MSNRLATRTHYIDTNLIHRYITLPKASHRLFQITRILLTQKRWASIMIFLYISLRRQRWQFSIGRQTVPIRHSIYIGLKIGNIRSITIILSFLHTGYAYIILGQMFRYVLFVMDFTWGCVMRDGDRGMRLGGGEESGFKKGLVLGF